MVRPKVEREREKISATLPTEIIAWMDTKVADRTFANRSHALEKALLVLKEQMTGPSK